MLLEKVMIKAIIFDLDGTLIGQKKASSVVLTQFYSDNKMKFNNLGQKEFFDIWKKSGRKNLSEFLRGELTFEEIIINQILEFFKELKIPIEKKEAKELYNKFLPIYEENMVLFEDVIPCLEFLKDEGYKIGIITNGNRKDQMEKLNRFGLTKFFSTITISGDVGVAKPGVEIFDKCIKQFDLFPDNIMYIGDLIEMDVYGAQNAGMRGVWLNRESKETEFEGTSIKDLKELEKLLE